MIISGKENKWTNGLINSNARGTHVPKSWCPHPTLAQAFFVPDLVQSQVWAVTSSVPDLFKLPYAFYSFTK